MLVLVAAGAAVGALLGVVWEVVWQAPGGTAYQGDWYLTPDGLPDEVSGTAWFAVLGLGGGLLLGVVAGLGARNHELITLLGVCLASLVAGWVMFHVGHVLGPPDPYVIAKDAPDLTSIPSDLRLAGASTEPWPLWFESSAFSAFPIGALIGIVGVLFSRPSSRGSVR